MPEQQSDRESGAGFRQREAARGDEDHRLHPAVRVVRQALHHHDSPGPRPVVGHHQPPARGNATGPEMLRPSLRGALLPTMITLVGLGCFAAEAEAAGPAGLPGPPPGVAAGPPLPPPPGQAPPAQASLPATTLSGVPYGPGLLSGYSAVKGTKLPVTIACQANGKAQFRAGSVSVKNTYRCSKGRSTIQFALKRSQAGGIARNSGLVGALTLTQGAQTVRLSLSLGPKAPTPVFWTSAFGLGCTAGGAQSAQLVAPNFTSTAAPTTIDVRPWLAWYSSATGWQGVRNRRPRRGGGGSR